MKRTPLTAVVLVVCLVSLNAVSFAVSIPPTDIDFDTEIVPLLSKAGCNAASCHGSAAGQAGFRLSLFGGDPGFDYRTIVHELAGRRINHLHPKQSLLLAKPGGLLDHGGGEVLDLDGLAGDTIARWIASGTPRPQLRKLIKLKIAPKEFVASSVPTTFQLHVQAIFDDGTQRDVTQTAVYVSQNESGLRVNATGHVRVTGKGRQLATIRYGEQVRTVSVTTPIGDTMVGNASFPRNNWIDDEVNETLQTLRLKPAATANDATFLRRLSLDLTGRLPEPTQVWTFTSEDRLTKRSALIDHLLSSVEFTNYWTHRLAKQLRLRPPGTDALAAETFYAWLQQQVANDTGWNKTASAVILSEGDTHQAGAAMVHRLFATARDEAEYITETMLGVRLRCANCHNHPLDRWTQDDYHGLAAIFAGLERGTTVRFSGQGQLMHPRTGAAAQPKIPGHRFLKNGNEDHRRVFADWLTSPENPYFAKAMAGRVWESLMGRGLVTPVDDQRASNPATHPQLLQRLADFFVEEDYKLRPLIKLICESAAYQRASQSGDKSVADPFYSATLPKQLSAEVLADALSDVTDVASNYDGIARAIEVIDRASAMDTLQFLGQCVAEDDGCSATSGSSRGIASKLHLMNGALLNQKLEHPGGRLQVMLSKQATTEDLVREFYLRALSRQPTDTELDLWLARIDSTSDRQDRAERCNDFVWALLNCQEFTTNH